MERREEVKVTEESGEELGDPMSRVKLYSCV